MQVLNVSGILNKNQWYLEALIVEKQYMDRSCFNYPIDLSAWKT